MSLSTACQGELLTIRGPGKAEDQIFVEVRQLFFHSTFYSLAAYVCTMTPINVGHRAPVGSPANVEFKDVQDRMWLTSLDWVDRSLDCPWFKKGRGNPFAVRRHR